MNEFESDWTSLSQSFEQNGWIQDGRIKDGRIQDGCHHQVESEWTSEVFFVQMAESKIAEFKLGTIIKLSQNEWVKFSFVQMAESMMAEFKMAAIIKYESEWMSLSQRFWAKWLNPRWQN